MRVLEGRQVFLEEGEVMPVWCDCGAIYQPAPNSYSSICPECKARNVHSEVDVVKQAVN
jgi:predicted Zn-ribbon and HTH transcriptional regulator